MRKELRKAQVLGAIEDYTSDHGYPPSYRELGGELGIAHSAVHLYVRELKADGLINDNPSHARALTLTAAGLELAHSGNGRKPAE
jgi:repressor LexA